MSIPNIMSTYLESALADFIKTILTQGIRTLKSPRFFPYTAFLLLLVIIGTITAFFEDLTGSPVGNDIQNLILYVEIAASLAFILVGLLLGRSGTIFQLLSILGIVASITSLFYFEYVGDSLRIASSIAAIMYILWIGIITFSTFSLIRDLFASSTFGTVLFLGKPHDDGEVMFKYICGLLALVNFGLGYLIYSKPGISQSSYYSALIIMITAALAILPLLSIQRKHDVFYTILSWFYMFTTIRVFLLAFRTLSGTSGETSYWDTLFSLFIALYAIQNAAAKGIRLGKKTDQSLEEEIMEKETTIGISRTIARILSDRGIVLVILGIVLGFHTMQVQTILGRENFFQEFALTSDADIVLLGYEVNLAISLMIYIFSMIFFFILPPFRRFGNPEVTRIPWAPPYDDLKLVISGIKEGDISWKGDTMKFIIGIGKDKIAGKFGRKPKSIGDRFSESWGSLIGKSKKSKK